MNDFIQIVISQVLLIFMVFGVIQFMSNGFFLIFMKVKASRGKKTLVEVHALHDTYYVVGLAKEKLLTYKKRGMKEKTRLKIEKGDIFRKIGVNAIVVNEVNDEVINPSFSSKSGVDPITYDNLLNRSIMAPHLEDKLTKLMFMGIVLITIGTAANLYLAYTDSETLLSVKSGVDACVKGNAEIKTMLEQLLKSTTGEV